MDKHGRMSSQIQQIHAYQMLRCIWDGASWSWHPHCKCAAVLVPYIMAIWRYHHREYHITSESPECVDVPFNYQHMSAKDDKRMRKSGSSTVEMSKQQANVAQRLADILCLSRSWIKRRWCLWPSGWWSRYHYGILCTWICPFWQEYHQDTQWWHRCVGIASLLVPWQSTLLQITNEELE